MGYRQGFFVFASKLGMYTKHLSTELTGNQYVLCSEMKITGKLPPVQTPRICRSRVSGEISRVMRILVGKPATAPYRLLPPACHEIKQGRRKIDNWGGGQYSYIRVHRL